MGFGLNRCSFGDSQSEDATVQLTEITRRTISHFFLFLTDLLFSHKAVMTAECPVLSSTLLALNN